MGVESVQPGDNTKLIACDDVDGDRYQLMKVCYGSDGTATMADATNRLPVQATVSGTVPVSGTVTVGSAPPSARATDSVAAAAQSDAIMVGGTACTPKFAFSNVAASTTAGTLVAAVTGKKIRVIGFRLNVAGTATNVTLNSASAARTETFQLDARAVWSSGFSQVGHLETNVGEALTVTTGAGSQVGVDVVYIEV